MTGFDRLWPVLVALALLIGGAIALEEIARHYHPAHSIRIQGDNAAISDEDREDDAGGGFASSPPLSAEHAQARIQARRGEVIAAIELYRKVLVAHPDAAAIHAELGYWLLAADDAKAARVELERAAALDATDPWIRLNLGVALARVDDLGGAEAQYRAAIARRPKFGAAELALGTVLRRAGKLDEAIEVLQAAATSGSNDQRARCLAALGRAQLAADRREAAVASFSRAIEFAPAAAEMRIAIARAWLSSGLPDDLRRAVGLLEQAAQLAPDVAPVFSALGRAREKLGDRAAAAAAYTRTLRIDPDHLYARRRVLRLALDREDFPEARMHAEYLLGSAPDVAEHHFLAGLVAARADRFDEARTHYRAAIDQAKGAYPEAYFNLAISEKKAKRFDDAVAAYRQAIELRPDYQQAWNNLGLLLASTGKPVDAEAALRRALSIDPRYAAAWLNLGELLGDQNRDEEAIAAFRLAIEARPDYAEAQLDLGVSLVRAGHADEAITVYRTLLAAKPRYVAAWYNLGLAFEARAAQGDADAAFNAAIAIDPEHLPSLRKRAARTTRGPTAVRAWQDVVDRAPGDVSARLSLANARLEVGDVAGCARDLRALPAGTENARAEKLVKACGS